MKNALILAGKIAKRLSPGAVARLLSLDPDEILNLYSSLNWRPGLPRKIAWMAVRAALLAHSRNVQLNAKNIECFLRSGRKDEALSLCVRMLDSGLDRALFSRIAASVCEELLLFDKAIQLFRQAIEDNDILANELYLQCLLKRPEASPASLLDAHKEYASRHALSLPCTEPLSAPPWDGARRLKIGFTCSFFSSSTIQHQFFCWLKHLDQAKFEIFLYVGDNPVPSYLRSLPGANIKWACKDKVDDAQFLATARADRLDILCELNGFTTGHRFLSMASRCAPIQVSYLNHVSTCGIPNVDYVLVDDLSLTESEPKFFTETPYVIPGCFFCFNFEDENMPCSKEPPLLRNGFATFGFFGAVTKLNNDFLSLMASVLQAVPDSRLLMAGNGFTSPSVASKLDLFFKERGIDSSRLRILPGTSREGVARHYANVDIAFDSWPYCGGNTLAEGFWYGVPAITLFGDRFASRYGASQLRAVGLDDLVAVSKEEYIEKAAMLASAPQRLRSFRVALRPAMLKEGGYGDVKTFARRIGDAFEDMAIKSQASCRRTGTARIET